jgi:hypothetical protein
MFRRVLVSLFPIACAPFAVAADDDFRLNTLPDLAPLPAETQFIPSMEYGNYYELRVGSTVPGKSYHLSRTKDNSEIDGTFDGRFRLDLAFNGSPNGLSDAGGGLIMGMGFNYDHGTGRYRNKSDLTFNLWAFEFTLGWGYPFTRNLQLEIMPFLGLGMDSLAIDQIGGPNYFDGSGFAFEYGLHGNLVLTSDEGFQIGLTVGLIKSVANATSSMDSLDTYTVTSSGAMAGLFFGGRF